MDISKLKNKDLAKWIQGWIDLCTPDAVVLATGDQKQYDELGAQMVAAGAFIRLNDKKKPNSYAVRSDVGDVARVEERTFICSKTKVAAGPTHNWCDPVEMKAILCGKQNGLFKG